MTTVRTTAGALDELDRLPGVIQRRVRKVLHRLQNWPDVSGVKELSGNLAGWYRILTGDYRIRFRVVSAGIIVDKIGHRKDVYED